MQVQAGRNISVGEALCTLIDLSSLEVEFNLLEQEIASLAEQSAVYVHPIASPDLRIPAKLNIINPQVEDGGFLRVRARLGSTGQARLYPGMNVDVILEATSAAAVLVPKQAVVLRSGKPVVFTYDADQGRAKWQYVTVAYENDRQVALSEGVQAGQQVITSGNLHIDHDSKAQLEVK